ARTTRQHARAESTRLQAAVTEAQRPVLVYVGAALTARDNVVEAVRPYTSRASAQRELRRLRRRLGVNLRKFERRGTTERNKLERQVKRTRTQAERELRQRRQAAERVLRRSQRDFERGADKVSDGAGDIVSGVGELAASAR
ncbi:MAG: hypothetical protein H0U12_04615, partial [Thermoleophilaceae bacterium]|nr:hypothetical protein [Thermoleophilaceae bacterium]